MPDLFSSPLISGGLVLMLTGAAFAMLRKTPEALGAWLRRLVSVEVEIRDGNMIERVTLWLAHHVQHRPRATLASLFFPVDRELPDVVLGPGHCSHLVRYGGRWLWLRRCLDAPPGGMSIASEKLTIRALGRETAQLRSFLQEAVAVWARFHRGHSPLFVSCGNHWARLPGSSPPPLSSVILPPGVVEDLTADLEAFLGSRERYAEQGIPWGCGYLFEGAPGSGKSTLARVIAGHCALPVYCPALADKTMGDRQLAILLAEVPAPAIVLIEDADCVIPGRERQAGELTLGGILNAIQGFAAGPGRIWILTTNHADKLDPALLRRFRRVTFAAATAEQATRLHRKLRPDASEFEARAWGGARAGLPMSELQDELLDGEPLAFRERGTRREDHDQPAPTDCSHDCRDDDADDYERDPSGREIGCCCPGRCLSPHPDHQRWECFTAEDVEDDGADRTICPNDGAALLPSADPKLPNCLECPECGFVQGFGTIVVGIEGAPS